MDEIDRKILIRLQGGIPITEKPFSDVGEELNLNGDEVISRLRKLKDEGIVRRFGAIIDYRKLGFKGTLVALKIPKERLEEVAGKINEISGVTHNYLRNFEYNLWFTLIEKSGQGLEKRLERIEQEIKPEKMLNLPVVREFKSGYIKKWTR